jgi:GNAT superfamily N-acetyltransferase
VTVRHLPGGLELDDDPGRIDVEAVHRFLSEESYWAQGRPLAKQEQLVKNASRVVGLYDEHGRQLGFCRAHTDGASYVYLADVYLLAEARGRGLGEELVREMVERGQFAHLRWILHTADMHPLYRKIGFSEPDAKLMERPARYR